MRISIGINSILRTKLNMHGGLIFVIQGEFRQLGPLKNKIIIQSAYYNGKCLPLPLCYDTTRISNNCFRTLSYHTPTIFIQHNDGTCVRSRLFNSGNIMIHKYFIALKIIYGATEHNSVSWNLMIIGLFK